MATKTAARTAKKSKKASKKLPVCTKKDLRKPKRKRRKCTVPKKKTTAKTVASTSRPSPAGAVAAPPATSGAPTASPTPWPTNGPTPMVTVPAAAVETPTPSPSTSPAPTDIPLENAEPVVEPTPTQYSEPAAGLSVYSGPFGVAQAQRLLFRAGFGPKPGQAEALAALGVRGAVSKLLNPGTVTLDGPAPTGSYLVGGQFAPLDKYGHVHLDWLDRMTRSTDSLTERMALVLQDWFGVSEGVVEKRLAYNFIERLRKNWRGSFRSLLQGVTTDPAMMIFLNITWSSKTAPNENYPRECMELYSLGADRGAYTEADVKAFARTLTGWCHDWSDIDRFTNFRFESARFDSGTKTLFAGKSYQRSVVTSTDAINAIVDHPLHPSFVVRKLWSYFIPSEPSAPTLQGLEALYRSSGERLDKLVEAILLHPDLYNGAAMTKPPVVFFAGLLRARRMGITTDAWIWQLQSAGQFVSHPPSVSGWNDRAWMNTSTFSARWTLVNKVLSTATVDPTVYQGRDETAAQAVASALGVWGNPVISADHYDLLLRVASKTWPGRIPGDTYGSNHYFLAQRQNVLRQLVAGAPDFHVS